MEDAVKIGENALKQAIEIGSDMIDACRDIYTSTLDYAADRIVDLVNMYGGAIDYVADKWQDMQNLTDQVGGWLKEQLAFAGQVGNVTTEIGL